MIRTAVKGLKKPFFESGAPEKGRERASEKKGVPGLLETSHNLVIARAP